MFTLSQYFEMLGRAAVTVTRGVRVGAPARTLFGDAFGQKGFGPIGASLANTANKVPVARVAVGHATARGGVPTFYRASYDTPILAAAAGMILVLGLPSAGSGLVDMLLDRNKKA